MEKKRVLIEGVDGYLGFTLAMYLASRGHTVGSVDFYQRRDWVAEIGSHSITPICSMTERVKAFSENFDTNLQFFRGDVCDYDFMYGIFEKFKPDAIVHLAEMPSAPYSMIDVHHAVYTHTNNLIGTLNTLYCMRDLCPDAHLVKLGTMGEYGTPNVDIPEGFFNIEYRGRKDYLPFPRQPGSLYHATKVHDTTNISLACKLWNLCSTDIMQGVVFGVHINEMGNDERLLTRFDADHCFGTAINRFCAQAIVGMPITPYGKGLQRRGFLPLQDSMQCFTIAIENPPEKGEYRVFNQFEEVYGITELAEMVQYAMKEVWEEDVEIRNIENPRMEAEEHYYNPDHQHLLDLGYKPTTDIKKEIRKTIYYLRNYKQRIEEKSHTLMPDIQWDGSKETAKYL